MNRNCDVNNIFTTRGTSMGFRSPCTARHHRTVPNPKDNHQGRARRRRYLWQSANRVRKTLAFGIPLVVRTKAAKPRKPQSLILAPTRELADQICKELQAFSGKRTVSVVYGGVSYGPQRKAIAKGVDILVACPARDSKTSSNNVN